MKTKMGYPKKNFPDYQKAEPMTKPRRPTFVQKKKHLKGNTNKPLSGEVLVIKEQK